jgi:hypothetical protein
MHSTQKGTLFTQAELYLGGWLPSVVSVSANSHSRIPVRQCTGRQQALQGTFRLRNQANNAV